MLGVRGGADDDGVCLELHYRLSPARLAWVQGNSCETTVENKYRKKTGGTKLLGYHTRFRMQGVERWYRQLFIRGHERNERYSRHWNNATLYDGLGHSLVWCSAVCLCAVCSALPTLKNGEWSNGAGVGAPENEVNHYHDNIPAANQSCVGLA